MASVGAANGARNGAGNGAAGGAAGPAAPIAPFPPMKSGGNGVAGRARERFSGPGNGAANGAGNGAEIDATYVVARLEEAGETLLCLPPGGYTTRLRTSSWTVLDDAANSYGANSYDKTGGRLRPPVPPAAAITRMDQALGWLRLIPDDRFVLRRIVASRMLVSPTTGRHLFPWRRLATLLGADHKAIQRWHGQGIALLVRALAP